MYTNRGKFAEMIDSNGSDIMPSNMAIEHKFLKLQGQWTQQQNTPLIAVEVTFQQDPVTNHLTNSSMAPWLVGWRPYGPHSDTPICVREVHQ